MDTSKICKSCGERLEFVHFTKAKTNPGGYANHCRFCNSKARCRVAEGHFYIISNPAYPGWFKIGRAKDVAQRLNVYNIASPFRDYHLEFTMAHSDYYYADYLVKYQLNLVYDFKHEWVQTDLTELTQSLITIIQNVPER